MVLQKMSGMERGQRNLGEGPPPSPLLQGTHDCRVDVETEDPDEEERVSAGGIYLNPRILQALQGVRIFCILLPTYLQPANYNPYTTFKSYYIILFPVCVTP